jgi:nucleoside-diphosphate-sugar epimerase
VIFHHAAIASVQRSITEPAAVETVNVGGTIGVMEAAARHGARRVVFAGSSAVYGLPESLPCRESHPTRPVSPYGVSKLAGEHHVRVLGDLRAVETVTLRYFNVFGDDQDPYSEYAAVIPRFITAIVGGQRPTVFGTGQATRDFVHVDDVVTANLLAAAASSPTGITCNIAAGTEHSLIELLEVIGGTLDANADPEFAPARAGDVERSVADISKARDELGFEVSVPFAEGVARTVAWFAEQSHDRESR